MLSAATYEFVGHTAQSTIPRLVLSPSQIKTWLPSAGGCNRKWAFHYILHLPQPEKKGTATGTNVHTQKQLHLNGLPFDCSSAAMRTAMEIAIPGLVNLPAPLAAPSAWPIPEAEQAQRDLVMRIERPFDFVMNNGLSFRGVKDVEVPDSKIIPTPEGALFACAGGAPGVIDHKSTKSTRYIKTVEELLKDEQSNIYAYDAMVRYKSPHADVVFNYVLTEGRPRTVRVGLRMYSPRVVEEMGRIQAAGFAMTVMYKEQPKPLDLTPNLEACDAFGGCPYKSLCTDLHSGPLGHLTPEEEMNMTQSGADLFAKIAATNAQEDAKAPLSAAAPPLFAPAPASVAAIPGISNVPPGFSIPLFLTPAAQQPTVAINPPEWQPPQTAEQRTAESAEVETPAAEEKAKRTRRTKAQIAADNLADLHKNGTSHAAPEQVPGIEAAGVIVKSETSEAFPPDTYVADPVTIPAPPSVGVVAPGCVPNKTVTLYLDCAPEGLGILRASDLYAEVNAGLEKTFSASNYRLIKYEGPGLFVAGFMKLFDQNPQDIVVDTRTAEGLLVVEVLRARAGMVVR